MLSRWRRNRAQKNAASAEAEESKSNAAPAAAAPPKAKPRRRQGPGYSPMPPQGMVMVAGQQHADTHRPVQAAPQHQHAFGRSSTAPLGQYGQYQQRVHQPAYYGDGVERKEPSAPPPPPQQLQQQYAPYPQGHVQPACHAPPNAPPPQQQQGPLYGQPAGKRAPQQYADPAWPHQQHQGQAWGAPPGPHLARPQAGGTLISGGPPGAPHAALVPVQMGAGGGVTYMVAGLQPPPPPSRAEQEAAIAALPTFPYRPPDAPGAPAHEECAVCLDPFEAGQTLRALPCLHRYHRECVDRWLLSDPDLACPTCKHDIRTTQ